MNHWFSHFGQDAWAAAILEFKRDGWFMDVGAFDGVTHSNSYALERDFSWSGICLEPNPDAYAKLCASRRCIALPFAAYSIPRAPMMLVDAGGLTSLMEYATHGHASARRKQVSHGYITTQGNTIDAVASQFRAPQVMDFLSLDVEGAEMQALTGWFQMGNSRRFRCATIEHGFDPKHREAIRGMMADNGYLVIDQNVRHDDYFWDPALIPPASDPVAMFHSIQQSYP